MNKVAMALVLSVLLSSGPSAAAEEGVVRVKLKGLDLDSSAGASTALSRIGRSANDFCKVRSAAFPAERVEARDCRRALIDKAVRQLGAPEVTARHDARVGGSPTLLARK